MNMILDILALILCAIGILAYTAARDTPTATYFVALACFMMLSKSTPQQGA